MFDVVAIAAGVVEVVVVVNVLNIVVGEAVGVKTHGFTDPAAWMLPRMYGCGLRTGALIQF